jgi:hypothetical protein
MDCNPYLCIAASLACGYLGMVNEIWPSKQYKGDAYEGEEDVPRLNGVDFQNAQLFKFIFDDVQQKPMQPFD